MALMKICVLLLSTHFLRLSGVYEVGRRARGVVYKAKSCKDMSYQFNVNKHSFMYAHNKASKIRSIINTCDLLLEKSWSDERNH